MSIQGGAILLLVMAGFISNHAQAATLNLDSGGNLLGASGIEVGGSHYDVSFGNGICADFWPRCGDITPEFTFQTASDAMAAATALITALFSANNAFDATPTLTNGCNDSSACYIITPYALDGDMETVFAYNAVNLSGGGSDTVIMASIGTYTPTNPDATYARWSVSVSPVPVPAAVWLFGTALVGLPAFGKRRKLL